MLWVGLHFPSLPPGSLEQVAAWACQFTPRVSLEPPQELLLEVEGSLRMLGGVDRLVARLRAGLTDMGFVGQFALAPTARAALWRARAGNGNKDGRGGRLELLPLEVACEKEALQFLKGLGISTLGELLQLPREGLARRCGQPLLDDLDRALGRLPEPRAFFAPPPRFAAKLELPFEVTHAEGLLFAARRLLVQLEGLLAAQHAGIRRFTLALLGREAQFACVEVGLAFPARDAERFMQLLRERLGVLSLSRPVDAIRLEAGEFAPLHASTVGMFGDARAETEGWARLLERLQARLGPDCVYGLTTQPDHRPELAWRRVAPGDWDPREFRQPGPRPVWLLEPRRLREDDFTLLSGPERIESGWWDGDDARRDYFIAQGANSALLWVYREAGAWFLHGLFA